MYVTCEEFLRTIDESSFGDVGQENSDSVLDWSRIQCPHLFSFSCSTNQTMKYDRSLVVVSSGPKLWVPREYDL